MDSIIKNGIENIWCYVDERDSGVVTINSATFEVFNSSDVSVQTSASATIADNGTATPDVYGLVDTTAVGFIACNTYYVLFSITIGTEILKLKQEFKVI